MYIRDVERVDAIDNTSESNLVFSFGDSFWWELKEDTVETVRV